MFIGSFHDETGCVDRPNVPSYISRPTRGVTNDDNYPLALELTDLGPLLLYNELHNHTAIAKPMEEYGGNSYERNKFSRAELRTHRNKNSLERAVSRGTLTRIAAHWTKLVYPGSRWPPHPLS